VQQSAAATGEELDRQPAHAASADKDDRLSGTRKE
jgi:hypothetical protein